MSRRRIPSGPRKNSGATVSVGSRFFFFFSDGGARRPIAVVSATRLQCSTRRDDILRLGKALIDACFLAPARPRLLNRLMAINMMRTKDV